MLLSVVLGLWCRLHAASAVTHSLLYFYTGVGGVSGFPEFTAVGLVDGQEFVHYDSDIKRMIPKTEWIERNEGKDYWDRETQIQDETWRIFRDSLGTLQERLGQAGGVHTLQEMYGCEWDEEDGATQGFDQWGYDGRDFIVFDLKTLSWVAPAPQAVSTKLKWESDTAFTKGTKNYLTQQCIEWLKTYVNYGRETLDRRERPQVSVFHKDSRSGGTELTCLATGFFPRDILVSWLRDGQDLQEDVQSGEVLPNGDGSFQVRKRLRVSEEEPNKHQYSCRVDHSSLEEEIIRIWEASTEPPISVNCQTAAAVMLWIVLVLGLYRYRPDLWRRHRSGRFLDNEITRWPTLTVWSTMRVLVITGAFCILTVVINFILTFLYWLLSSEPKSERVFPIGIIVGVVVGVLVLLAVVGIVIWRKRQTGYGKASTSDCNSESFAIKYQGEMWRPI